MWYWKIGQEKSTRYYETLDSCIQDIQFEFKKWQFKPSLVRFIKIGRKRIELPARVLGRGTIGMIITPDLTLFPQERGVL